MVWIIFCEAASDKFSSKMEFSTQYEQLYRYILEKLVKSFYWDKFNLLNVEEISEKKFPNKIWVFSNQQGIFESIWKMIKCLSNMRFFYSKLMIDFKMDSSNKKFVQN